MAGFILYTSIPSLLSKTRASNLAHPHDEGDEEIDMHRVPRAVQLPVKYINSFMVHAAIFLTNTFKCNLNKLVKSASLRAL